MQEERQGIYLTMVTIIEKEKKNSKELRNGSARSTKVALVQHFSENQRFRKAIGGALLLQAEI